MPPQVVRATPENIHLWGGSLCLDFANTVDWDAEFGYAAPERTDVLVSGPWVGRWARRVGIPGRGRISEAEVERLRELRRVIHRLFSRPAPPAVDLEALRDAVSEGMGAASVRPAAHGRPAEGAASGGGPPAIAPAWPGSDERRVRFAVAWDALLLLGDGERLARVTRCPGRNCGWLFLNASGRRRWCSMSSCGSREKMRRAYARRRGRRSRVR
jgi:predicted RNA-binding Zn ribbon-like protein